MKKTIRSKIAGIMAGFMTISSFSIPVFADVATTSEASQQIVMNGFTFEAEDWQTGWTVTDFDGSTTNAVIPDVIDSKGNTQEDPDKPVPGSVLYIEEDVFEKMENVETLKLPKWLSGPAKGKQYNTEIFTELKNLSEYNSNNEGTQFYTEDGALYAGKKIISYPQQKTGNYTIKDGTTSADGKAFVNAHIDTLTIPDGFKVDNQRDTNNNGEKYFKYTFLSSQIGNFEGANCVEGALIENGRLIAYGNNATADLSNITSANPYAFQNEEVLKNANLPESVLKTVPFSFYSGEEEGNQFRTRYFTIDGKTAYCYNYGKLNPESVGDLSDYDAAISSDEIRKEVTAILFAGYPNDAYGLLEQTGVDEETAKNITGSMVWKAVDNIDFSLDDIYGIEYINAAETYLTALNDKVTKVSDEEVKDFELKFYHSNDPDVQGLVVIHKISRPPVVPEKPSVSISKQDITNNKELPGAKLKVTKGDTLIAEWTSTDTPYLLKDLEDGVYTLTEVTAPKGYKLAESISFTVADGKVTPETIVMYDAPEDKFIYISKKDLTTGKELPGAKLKLTDKDGKIIEEWTSTEEVHKIANLPDGTYTLTEVTAPEGYEIAESITFEVKNGETEKSPIIMYDKAKTKPEKPSKPPIDGDYSGYDPKPDPEPEEDPDITIIPVPDPEPKPEETKPEETTPTKPPVERKPVKTGDILGTMESLFGVIMILGTGIIIYDKRKRQK